MENEALEPEVLDGIKPFSGSPDEMTSAERIISEGKALQRVQTPYTTAVAVQRPRSMSRVTKNVLEESKLAGSKFYYRWEVKNKKTGRKSIVQGPSIDLTMCIARNYGNCALDIEVQETLSHYLFKGTFIDLETGFTVPRLYRQRKRQNVGGGYGDDRSEDMVFQIGQSKAQRNCIDKAAPGWLVDQAIEEARQSEINKIKPENIHLARGKVLDFFATYGITQERMESKMERKADEWTPENIADLRGMATGLKEGRIDPDELFPDIEPNEPNLNQSTDGEGSTAESLFERLKKMRPSTSAANMAEWRKIVTDNVDNIRKFSPDEHKYIAAKWLKVCPGDLFPARPLTEEEKGGGNHEVGPGQGNPPDMNPPPPNGDEDISIDKKLENDEFWFTAMDEFLTILKLPQFNRILGRWECKVLTELPVELRYSVWRGMSTAVDEVNAR